MNATDCIRAGLTALAAAEDTAPSRIWEPVLPEDDDQPDWPESD
ncbi:hypothetical protein [Streptomyces collinus]